MRTFAENPKASQQPTSAKTATPARAHLGQVREVNSILRLQRTIGNEALLEADTGNGKGDSSTAGIARFGHDFSRIPVHAASPIAVEDSSTFSSNISTMDGNKLGGQRHEDEPTKPLHSAPLTVESYSAPRGTHRSLAPNPLSTPRGQSPSEPALPVPMRGAFPSVAYDFSHIPLFLSSRSGALAFADRALAKCRPKDAGVEEPSTLDSPPVTPKPVTANPVTAKHVTPTFVLDKKEDPRSNTKPSTQSKSPPTFVGKVAGDGKVWHYELSSVESKGKIRIVYFTDDRYPAPTPTDDSGALSNVTKTNWKTIVDDLEKNKEGIPDFWSAYRAEDVHETYHWEVEWQGEMKKELVKAENDIAALSVGVDKAPTAVAAEKVLAPQATTVFNDAMKRADVSYQALPDSPGAPAYKAQIPVVTALKNRVNDHAKTNKW